MKAGMVSLAAFMALGACASPYGGMMGMPRGGMPLEGGEINAFPGDDSDKLLAGLNAAEAKAARPGDAALTCDQLGREMTAIALDPSVLDVSRKMGTSEALIADLQRQKAAMDVTVGAYLAVSILSQLAGYIPGGELYAGAASTAQMALGATINAQQEAMTAQTMQKAMLVTPILPQLMRGNRVQELADGKSCTFLKKPA